MTPEQILFVLVSWWPWIFVKLLIIILLLFYLVFAGIILRQIDLMNRVVEAQISPLLGLIGFIHLGAAVFIFFLALFLL